MQHPNKQTHRFVAPSIHASKKKIKGGKCNTPTNKQTGLPRELTKHTKKKSRGENATPQQTNTQVCRAIYPCIQKKNQGGKMQHPNKQTNRIAARTNQAYKKKIKGGKCNTPTNKHTGLSRHLSMHPKKKSRGENATPQQT